MWFWLHSGWLLLLVPLAMMIACVLMCFFARAFRSGGCAGCCGHTQHSEPHQ